MFCPQSCSFFSSVAGDNITAVVVFLQPVNTFEAIFQHGKHSHRPANTFFGGRQHEWPGPLICANLCIWGSRDTVIMAWILWYCLEQVWPSEQRTWNRIFLLCSSTPTWYLVVMLINTWNRHKRFKSRIFMQLHDPRLWSTLNDENVESWPSPPTCHP